MMDQMGNIKTVCKNQKYGKLSSGNEQFKYSIQFLNHIFPILFFDCSINLILLDILCIKSKGFAKFQERGGLCLIF